MESFEEERLANGTGFFLLWSLSISFQYDTQWDQQYANASKPTEFDDWYGSETEDGGDTGGGEEEEDYQ